LGTNNIGEVVWRWEGQAFGEADAQNDVDGNGELVEINLRFPGQYYDAETQMHYNYFRNYDPGTGRYGQSDPIGVLYDYIDPQLQVASFGENFDGVVVHEVSRLFIQNKGLNSIYGYVDQAPLTSTDLFGLAPNITCEQKLRACRARTGRHPILGGANRVKCEEKYGALSDCKDNDDDEKNQCKI